jgi:hypothetical protein
MAAIEDVARQCAEWDPNPETRDATLRMISSGSRAELEKHFGARLEFGTAGLRGPMGPGYNCMSDVLVMQAAQVRDSLSRAQVLPAQGRRSREA